MSLNRENICWPTTPEQQELGAKAWRIGFFCFDVVGEDSEWDVEYFDGFWFVAEGNTADEAYTVYQDYHGNPGGSNEISTRDADEDKCQKFDNWFDECKNKQRAWR